MDPVEKGQLSWRITILFFVAVFLTNLAVVALKRSTQPPQGGDAMDYDAIAFCLAQGDGFGLDRANPQWQKPYLEATDPKDIEAYAHQRPRWVGTYTPTAYRPPALPYALAGIYKTVGRHFIVWRIINAALVAWALTVALRLAGQLGGKGVAFIAGGIALCDPISKGYVANVLTEGPIMLGVALLAWALVSLACAEQGRWRYAALAGAVAGAMVLTRSMFVLWYPLLTLGVIGLAWRGRFRFPGWGTALVAGVIFATAATAVVLPWWARNCVVLDAMMPLGTQGGIGIPGGFSQASLDNHGAWVDADSFGFFDPLYANLPAEGHELSPLEMEKRKAQYGQTQTLAWIIAHRGKVAQLTGWKLVTHWTGQKARVALVLLLLGLAGLWGCRPSRAQAALWLIIGCNVLAVMGTYATGDGRFVVPILPVLYVVAGIGTWHVIEWWSSPRGAITSARKPSS